MDKEKKKCKMSIFYSRDEAHTLHFYCDFCDKEMYYEEERICGNQNREKCPNCGKELGISDCIEGECMICDYKITDDKLKKYGINKGYLGINKIKRYNQ